VLEVNENQKQNFSNNKGKTILKHQSPILREVANSLQNYTYKPTLFEISNVKKYVINIEHFLAMVTIAITKF
jgi:hypothetical protein